MRIINKRKFDRLQRYLSIKKYCDVRHIEFTLLLCEYERLIEKGCFVCNEKQYLNEVFLKDLSKGYTYNNVSTICRNCLNKIKKN